MGAQTRQVGGGAASPVANDFNAFLSQQLTGRQTNPQLMGLQQMRQSAQAGRFGAASGTVNRALDAAIRQQQANMQQPQQQSQSAFQNAFGQALSGQVQDQSGAQNALRNFFSNPQQNFGLPDFQNPFNAPQYQGHRIFTKIRIDIGSFPRRFPIRMIALP